MKKYNISANLIHVIKYFYNKASSAVLFKGTIEVWFRTTVGLRQVCLFSLPPPSPTPTHPPSNIVLERIMTDALDDHEGTVSIGGRTITSLSCANDIDGSAVEEEERAELLSVSTKPPEPTAGI